MLYLHVSADEERGRKRFFVLSATCETLKMVCFDVSEQRDDGILM